MSKLRKTIKSNRLLPNRFAQLADQGQDVSRFFMGKGRMVQPIQRVNVDVTASIEELDEAAQTLAVKR